jgi:DHA2 family methylenomycin A resistance protein-like MFS transporter
MLPASMALIREAFPDPRRRTHALGFWAVGGAIAGAVGPSVGGLLTTWDWRLVFGINLPVCIAMLALATRVRTSPTRPSPFDWAGQLASLAALTALTYGLIAGGAHGFGAGPLIALALAVAAIAAFLLIQARAKHPMMPLGLFQPRGMRIALAAGFAFMVGNFGSVFTMSLYLQQHLGMPPLLAGLVFLPSSAFSIMGNIVSGDGLDEKLDRAESQLLHLAFVYGDRGILVTRYSERDFVLQLHPDVPFGTTREQRLC